MHASHPAVLHPIPQSQTPPALHTSLCPPPPGYSPQLWQAGVLSLTLFTARIFIIIFLRVILIAGQDAGSNMVTVFLCVSVCVCHNGFACVCVFSVLLSACVSKSESVCAWMDVCMHVRDCVCVSMDVVSAVPVLCLCSLCEHLPLSFYYLPSPSLSLSMHGLLTLPRFAPLPLLVRLSTVRSMRDSKKEKREKVEVGLEYGLSLASIYPSLSLLTCLSFSLRQRCSALYNNTPTEQGWEG